MSGNAIMEVCSTCLYWKDRYNAVNERLKQCQHTKFFYGFQIGRSEALAVRGRRMLWKLSTN